jgi:alkylhydroperoxidase/carboxymuconolactone decarboxylase family protein YurZ
MTNRDAGINVVREMMGDQAAAKLSASGDSNTVGAPIAAYAVDQVCADIWTRPGLDKRSRSLVSMSTKTTLATTACFDTNGIRIAGVERRSTVFLPTSSGTSAG